MGGKVSKNHRTWFEWKYTLLHNHISFSLNENKGSYFWKWPRRNQTVQNRGSVSAAIHLCHLLVRSQHVYIGSLVYSWAPKKGIPLLHVFWGVLSYVIVWESLWKSLQIFLSINLFLFTLLNILVDSISCTCKKHPLRFTSNLCWDRREERWQMCF